MKITEHDVNTDTTIEREATADEIKAIEAQIARDAIANKTAEAAKAEHDAKKAAVLAKLGLTSEEVTSLLA
jgi:hypothetical protein